MEYCTIKVDIHENKIGVITLNHPEKRNVLSIQMRKEISHCLHDWRESSTIEALIFKGNGSSFCAGFDLNEFNNRPGFCDIRLCSESAIFGYPEI